MTEYSAPELFSGVETQFRRTADLVATLQASTAGAAGGSELLFTAVYDKLVKRKDDPEAPVFLMGFDNLAIQAEKALYDLAEWCRGKKDLAEYIKQTSAIELEKRWQETDALSGIDAEVWKEFQARFQGYLEEHGHSIYEMDFMKPLPGEEPAPMLETLKMYLSGEGKNPYQRQEEFAHRREQVVQDIRARTGGLKRKLFNMTLGWAQHLAPWREDGISYIGYGYPLLKEMLHELGRRMVRSGIMESPEDIYWLRKDEIRAALEGLDRGETGESKAEEIVQRKALWQARKQVTPPPVLPPKKKMLGINVEAFLPMSEEAQTGEAIKGLGASPGKVTGMARVLGGPQDFDQMRPGEVLVATNTTPAWTPLFAMAAAIVTDIGGPLSHGSIVAREYGIPAVLGTGVATRRIKSGQSITVDGNAGIVTLN
jgi:phosphohistidine swiveling domain-containing protein